MVYCGDFCKGWWNHLSPTTEGILQVLSSSSVEILWTLITPEQAPGSTSNLPAPLASFPCSFSLVFPLKDSLTPATLEKAVLSIEVEKRPPPGWGGKGENTGLRVQPEILGSQPEGDTREVSPAILSSQETSFSMTRTKHAPQHKKCERGCSHTSQIPQRLLGPGLVSGYLTGSEVRDPADFLLCSHKFTLGVLLNFSGPHYASP